MNKRPNILFITADELRADACGFLGAKVCKTPHLDALAARGVSLRQHFTVHGKCVPSRCAMQTGRYCHTDAIRTVNGTNHLQKDEPNLMQHLRSLGYETAVFGHNHVWDEEHFWAGNKKSAGCVDYHSFTEGYFDDLAKREILAEGASTVGDHPELAQIDYVGRKTGDVGSFSDENRAAQAQRYLRTVRDRNKPFYLHLNIGKPHPPYGIQEPWYSMYDRQAIDLYPGELPKNAPLYLRAMRELRLGNDISEAARREIQATYYGMVSYADHCIGQVLETLRAEGLEENTLVLFTSDHGDFSGQYGLNEKWDTAIQDCILRTPCLLAGPGLPVGAQVNSLSEHVDFPATFFELLGEARPEPWVWHGESLLPIIRGERHKAAVFADGGHEAPMRARFQGNPWFTTKDGRTVKATGGKQLVYKTYPDSMARVKMVRTPEWKFAVRETGDHELYHLPSDPWELNNRYGEAGLESVLLDLQMQLLQWCLRSDQDRPFQPYVGA